MVKGVPLKVVVIGLACCRDGHTSGKSGTFGPGEFPCEQVKKCPPAHRSTVPAPPRSVAERTRSTPQPQHDPRYGQQMQAEDVAYASFSFYDVRFLEADLKWETEGTPFCFDGSPFGENMRFGSHTK